MKERDRKNRGGCDAMRCDAMRCDGMRWDGERRGWLKILLIILLHYWNYSLFWEKRGIIIVIVRITMGVHNNIN